jgi:CARDB protein/beta-propeller repeat-containing protein
MRRIINQLVGGEAQKRFVKLILGPMLVLMTFVYQGGLPSISNTPISAPAHSSDSATKAQLIRAYGNLPLSFEVNQDQTSAQVKFPFHGKGYTLLGGIGNDEGNLLAVDSSGNAYVTGSTSSTNSPKISEALRMIFGAGVHDAFATENAITMSPDLSGSLSVITQNCQGSGASLQCTIEGTLRVENSGTVIAQQSVVRFFLSTDNTLDDSDTLLEETQVTELDPGESQEVNFQAQLPPGENGFGEFVIALLDATNVVPEANEENNIVVSPRIIGNELVVGCAIGGTVSGVGTAAANLLILLVPAFAIAFRLILSRIIYPNIRS